jgi:peptidoglycan/LPS O-acetylase OafA/YrhL
MGIFRLCLAFCVVLAHGLNLRIPAATADVAVQTFYIVSGFYMGLILTEKYRDAASFLTNRILRLYPMYAVVMLVTVAHSLLRMMVGHAAAEPGLLPYVDHFSLLNIPSRAYLVATNLTLCGQDIALFLRTTPDGHALAFTTNFASSIPRVEQFLLVPQAWSLSIELYFYLLAPWLVARSTRVLLMVLSASVALRLALVAAGLSFDPWTYRFFPTELALFVLGVLIYRSMRTRTAPRLVQGIALAGLVLGAATLSAIPGEVLKRLAFYAYCVWALPLVFQLTRRSRLDRYVGELSYPIYLSHLVVISLALYSHLSGVLLAVLILVMVLGASILLQELVQKPVDRYREARVAAPPDTIVGAVAGSAAG